MVIDGNPDITPVSPVAGLTVVWVDATTSLPCAYLKVPVTVCWEGLVDVGVNEPLMSQEAPANKVAPHVLEKLPEFELVVTPVALAVPLFVNRKTKVADVFTTILDGNGVVTEEPITTVALGGMTVVCVDVTISLPCAYLKVPVTVCWEGFVAVGVNVPLMVQEAPGDKEVPHVLVKPLTLELVVMPVALAVPLLVNRKPKVADVLTTMFNGNGVVTEELMLTLPLGGTTVVWVDVTSALP
jgi:hypothetical protein